MTDITFPTGFIWGVASSAFQIEGAWREDGKGPSIWDTFSHTPGKIAHNHNADRAIDHYHRMDEDLDLIASLGIRAYRFSTAWTRILPQGKGAVNTRGLDFYDRLVDGCLARGIIPMPCLYHYDLPQALQDAGGGWKNRETAYHFAEYAALVTQRLSDRADVFFTMNEPFITAVHGYLFGNHAPGEKNLFGALKAAYHLMLAHGLASQSMRAAARQPVRVGITLNFSPTYPATPTRGDRYAAETAHMLVNRSMLELLLLGSTPLTKTIFKPWLSALIKPGDLQAIRNLDILGVNYYSRIVLKSGWKAFPTFVRDVRRVPESDYSDMWEIYPPGIYDLLKRIWNDYSAPTNDSQRITMPDLWITENGVCVPDTLTPDGQVHDPRRVRYLHDHLVQVQRLIQEGVPVKGYFVWSYADNFEWQLGYDPRFGLIHVDFDDLSKTIKDSGKWYARAIQANGFDLLPNPPGPIA